MNGASRSSTSATPSTEPANHPGGGHFRVTFSNGKRVTIPATPSDYRGKKNTILACERAAGRRLPRQRTGKFTFKRPHRSFADAPPSEKSDATLRNDAKMARLQEIDRTITRWLTHPPPSQKQAEKLLAERGALVDDLHARGLDAPDHYTQPVTER